MPAIPVCMAVAVKIYAVDFYVTAHQRSRETGVKEVRSGGFGAIFFKIFLGSSYFTTEIQRKDAL